MDHRDRRILALSALLRAERETRDAFEAAIAARALSAETLKAIVGDRIQAITQDDLNLAEDCASPYRPSKKLELA